MRTWHLIYPLLVRQITNKDTFKVQALRSESPLLPGLKKLPAGYYDSIISVHIPLTNQQYATLFSVYSPTLPADPTEKNKFYSDLHSLLQDTPVNDKVIILGDFNARVGQSSVAWKGMFERHGIGIYTDNECLL